MTIDIRKAVRRLRSRQASTGSNHIYNHRPTFVFPSEANRMEIDNSYMDKYFIILCTFPFIVNSFIM
jgi:hypothetical protein